MRGWLSVLSWYTLVVGGLTVLGVPFLVGKTVTYAAGGVALGIVMTVPTLALGVLGLVVRNRLGGSERPGGS